MPIHATASRIVCGAGGQGAGRAGGGGVSGSPSRRSLGPSKPRAQRLALPQGP